MSGHTPRAWEYRPKGRIMHATLNTDSGLVVFKTPPTESDARLIAASPRLLTSGQGLLDVVRAAIKAGDWKVDGACDPERAIGAIEQAIKDATGERA